MKTFTAIGLGLALLASTPAAHADINIGVSMALTGPAASLGLPARNALGLWPSEIAGEKVVLHVLDDAGDPTIATKNARRFVEDGMDAILGSVNTPSTIAIAQVANEYKVVQLSPSPAELPPGKDEWTFRSVMNADFYVEGLIEHLQKAGIKKVGFLGLSDAFGEAYLVALKKRLEPAGLQLVATERFTRGDSNVAAQALKVVSSAPEAVVVVAVGSGAALPQRALVDLNYKGRIYQSAAAISPDYLRLSGKAAEGTYVLSGPEQLPAEMPADQPSREVAMRFQQEFEKQFGAGTMTQFAANVFDFGLVLDAVVPVALETAKPGTQEFRASLRNAIENNDGVVVTKGLLHYTPQDHWGHGPDARIVLLVREGKWTRAD